MPPINEEKAKIIKNEKVKISPLFILIFLIVVAFAINPIADFIDNQIVRTSINQLGAQLIQYKLPEKTDLLEEVCYGVPNNLSVLLLLKSNLSIESIKGYYHSSSFKPVNSRDTLKIYIDGPFQEREDTNVAMAEDLADPEHGSIRKLINDSAYQSYYVVFLSESR